MNFTTPTAKPKWEKTAEGWLRCKSRVLAERIMPYHWKELDLEGVMLPEIVNMAVMGEEMGRPETLRSLEGVPVVAGEHQWLEGNVSRFAVGAVAGTGRLNPPYLECDLLITDPKTIAAVERGELPEISAAYQAETIFGKGAFDDEVYDAIQTNLRFNHICLLPAGQGRAGEDVRILNKRKETVVMSKSQAFENGRAKALAEIEAKIQKFKQSKDGDHYEQPTQQNHFSNSARNIGFSADPEEAFKTVIRKVQNARQPGKDPNNYTPADVRRLMNARFDASRDYTIAVETKKIANLYQLGFLNSNEALEKVQALHQKQALRPCVQELPTAYEALKPTNRRPMVTQNDKLRALGFKVEE